MSRHGSQRGAVLVISMVMLIALTMFVISMLYTSNTNLKVVGNMQAQRQLEAVAQKVVEDRISSLAFFEDAIAATGIWPTGTNTIVSTEQGFTVTVYRPVCNWTEPEEGSSALNPLVPEQTVWTVRVVATDPVTSGSADVSQGVRMRMRPDHCPA
ncbi:MAG TPA: hypothetical protein VIQ28_07885 [Burkholderiales bacterium]